jgi:hypothetical protein
MMGKNEGGWVERDETEVDNDEKGGIWIDRQGVAMNSGKKERSR